MRKNLLRPETYSKDNKKPKINLNNKDLTKEIIKIIKNSVDSSNAIKPINLPLSKYSSPSRQFPTKTIPWVIPNCGTPTTNILTICSKTHSNIFPTSRSSKTIKKLSLSVLSTAMMCLYAFQQVEVKVSFSKS